MFFVCFVSIAVYIDSLCISTFIPDKKFMNFLVIESSISIST